ncbi:MAG: glycosyltransferase [Paludibacteraceae bacterium]|nr:glycosyltransferase [Paludibacteraceae bacterium]
MKDRISIALASYNGARFLRDQLDSLYTQTLLPDEVVVCDDASTDGTADILKEYHDKYGLKYVINDHSLGCNQNFFKAIDLCSGEYICICDQDDIWLPNKIETVYHKIHSLDNSKPLCVSSLRYDIDAEGNIIGEVNGPETSGWRGTLLSYGRNQGCTLIINRLLKDLVMDIVHNKPDLASQMYYDELISYSAVIKGEKVNLPDKLIYYRHHDKNTVDPFVGKLTFREKVRRVPVFWGFTIDERLIPLCTTKKIFNGDIEDASLDAFLTDVTEMMTKPHVWSKLVRILQCHQLSIQQRFNIAFKSTISILLKSIYRYPLL